VLDRLDQINAHISAFKKEISDFGDVVLRLEDSIGGNKFSDNKGLFHKVERLHDKTEELKNEITLLNERMETYKSGYTWASRLGISSMIAFIIWFFTKK
jgi:archaellum component FlaC